MSTKKNLTWLLIPIITLIATISHAPKLTQADELQTTSTDATSSAINEKDATGKAYDTTTTDTEKSATWPAWKPVGEFSDVKEGNSHYVAIEYLRTNGIIEGYTMNGENKFKPNQKISRAEALKIFLLASKTITDVIKDVVDKGYELRNINEKPLSDVSLDSWFAPYVAIAKEKGIISGYEDGTFQPNKTINLAESLKIFLSCYPNIEYPSTDDIFTDAVSTDWFAKYAAYAKQKTLVDITLENKIDPNQDMTRGYMAEIIYRKIMNDTTKENFIEFGKATYYGNGANGANTASGEKLDNASFVAAHKTLPFGTIVEVKNLATGKSIQVKIIDRGPYGHGRIIDLSMGAFAALADLSVGVINVQDKVIHLP